MKKKKTTKKAVTRRSPETRFLDEVGRYLRSRGWNVLVAGPIVITREAGRTHQLVVGFMGFDSDQKDAQK